MKILFALLLTSVLCGCCCTEKYDLLDAKNAPQKKEVEKYGKDFYSVADGVQKKGDFYLVKAPKTKTKSFALLPRPLKLDSKGVYELRMRYAGQERVALNMYGQEFEGENVRWTRPLVRTMSYLNVNGSTDYRKEFAVSPGIDKIQPIFNLARGGANFVGTVLLLEELSIVRKGDMKFADSEQKKINYAADYDFSKYPVGDFRKIHKGNGPKAKKWSNIKAEIIECDGEKVLHIVRNKDNYIYPFIRLAPFKIDPRYHFVRVTLKAKGKGSFATGLWWQRPSLYFDYENAPKCELTDKWQTFTMTRPCMTADVKNAALSFTSYGDGEFFIKDIEVRFE